MQHDTCGGGHLSILIPMSIKPQTRFTISAGGQYRSLFSIREQSRGSLTIIPKSSKFYRDRPGPGRPQIKHHHISIHNSPNSPGNLFHETQTLDTQESIENHIFSHNIPAARFCIIYSKISPRIDIPFFTYTPRQKDRHINIGAYDPTRTCLAYALIISAAKVELQLFDPIVRSNHADFSLYRATIIWTYLSVPSFEDGVVSKQKTSKDWPEFLGLSSEEVQFDFRQRLELMRIQLVEYFNDLSQREVPPEYLIETSN